MEYYSAIKKNEIRSLAGKWKELKTIMLSEISQAQKPKYSHSFVEPRPKVMMTMVYECMWRLSVGHQWKGGGGKE
jgi:hypothetical protein